jgi:hypothetical protein
MVPTIPAAVSVEPFVPSSFRLFMESEEWKPRMSASTLYLVRISFAVSGCARRDSNSARCVGGGQKSRSFPRTC